jgi:hypothetical protein
MFCKVTISGTSTAKRSQNLFNAIKSIATATAGSTPTPEDVAGNAIDLTVISNAEAGSWEIATGVNGHGVADYYTPADGAVLVLRRPTGKPDLPYVYFVAVPAHGSNHWMPATIFDDDSPSWTDNDRWQNSLNNWCNPDYQYAGAAGLGATGAYADLTRSDQNNITYYIAATENYLHIHRELTYDWYHLGVRSHMPWEDNYSDNPYWVAMQYEYTEHYYTIMRQNNKETQTINGPYAYKANFHNQGGDARNARVLSGYDTGWNNNSPYDDSTTSGMMNLLQWRYNAWTHYVPNNGSISSSGVFNASWGTSNQYGLSGSQDRYLYQPVIWPVGQYYLGLTSDETTGALIPASMPITVRGTKGFQNGGELIGIQQGTNFDGTTARDAFFTQETTYTIDGEDYIGLLHANAQTVLFVKKA